MTRGKCRMFFLFLPLLAVAASTVQADPLIDLQRLAWFHGRDYFVLRSGRTRLIAAGRSSRPRPGLHLPALRCGKPKPEHSKDAAFNFLANEGCAPAPCRSYLAATPSTPSGRTPRPAGWLMAESPVWKRFGGPAASA